MNSYEPPRDEEAEAIVLGTLMHYPAAHAEAAELLQRDDFYQPAHQLIWDVITDRLAEGKTVAPAALVSAIQRLGRINLVRNGDLLWEASDKAIPGGAVGEFAQIVAETGELRRTSDMAVQLRTAIANGVGPDVLDGIIASHQERRRERATRSSTSSSLLKWDEFFATDFSATSFLPGRIMAEGQQIAFVGDGKAGKSLFCQEWAWRAGTGQPFLNHRASRPIRVLYLDAENGQDEIQRRLISFGARPGHMGELHYASFPPIPPLDTPAGGVALMALAQEVKAEMVFIDTVSRFISGPENDSDTWLSLYRATLMPLKRAGIASVRLDHFGKDKERGSRGSSAKTQDIDHVWELTAGMEGSLTLKRTHSRTGIGEDVFALRRFSQKHGDTYVPGATRHVLAGDAFGQPIAPGSVQDIAQQLDRAGVDPQLGRDRLREEAAALGIKVSNQLLSDVVKYRKHTAQNGTSHLSANLSPAVNTTTVPMLGTVGPIPADQTCPGQVPDSMGQAGSTPVPSPSSLGRGQVGQPRPGPTLCTACNTPLAAEWASKGYDVHLMCQEAG